MDKNNPRKEKQENAVSKTIPSESIINIPGNAAAEVVICPNEADITLCTCDACRYTFNPAVYHSKYPIPKRCPDCGKMKIGDRPAVRLATKTEIEDYWRIQVEMVEELGLVL